ncbi:hypothetical protein QQ045_006040 [Rhodiola kirilowii]
MCRTCQSKLPFNLNIADPIDIKNLISHTILMPNLSINSLTQNLQINQPGKTQVTYIMAFRAAMTSNMMRSSSMVSCLTRNRPFATTVDAAGSHHHSHHKPRSWAAKADYAPIYMVMGMVLVAVSIGVHTAKQQIMHSPAVKVSKKKRESMWEVDDPDVTVSSADKFISNSFLRKVAHIQESEHPDPSRGNPFTSPRHSESLKSVGVDPRFHG